MTSYIVYCRVGTSRAYLRRYWCRPPGRPEYSWTPLAAKADRFDTAEEAHEAAVQIGRYCRNRGTDPDLRVMSAGGGHDQTKGATT